VKLVGFGCSFTYGSELVDPGIGTEFHHANTRYRESNVWLGQLAKLLDATFDNRSEPGNSNYAIQYQFADWFNNNRNPDEHTVVCVAWTGLPRFSWLSDKWYHNNFISNSHLDNNIWKYSNREWTINKVDHNYWTDAARLFVNSVCKLHNIPILQFNALGDHKSTKYPNYFLDGSTMTSMLKNAQQNDDRLDLFASGGHPNELGHEYFTIRLHEFAKERII
jgi:hypothetical protein